MLGEHLCKLLAHMDDPAWVDGDPDLHTPPALDFGAGHIQRVLDELSRSCVAAADVDGPPRRPTSQVADHLLPPTRGSWLADEVEAATAARRVRLR